MEHNKDSEAIYIAQEDSHVVMSEKVQALAGSIYQEFERMINKYDEEVVKDLMPLVVNVLECLDLSYTENQEHEVELELLREDNEQLVTQYEREKQLRKNAEQKLLELEDHTEENAKDLTSKIESLEAIVRMLELKSKNSSDHVSRLEDKEGEMKKEYTKLHDRYTELFKTHMDYMERTKILMGTDRLENFGVPIKKLNSGMARSTGPVSFGFSSLENNSGNFKSFGGEGNFGQRRSQLQEEMTMDEDMPMEDESDAQNGEDDNDNDPSMSSQAKESGKSHTKKEERKGNSLYQELSFQDPDLESADITGSWVHPGEYASSVGGELVCVDVDSEHSSGSPIAQSSANVNDNFFGMGKEVENLILENNELLATKNALNIVKDDLIAKVDELSSEHEILREEIASVQAVKARLRLRIQELEDEVKRGKEEMEKKAAPKSDDEEDVPLAQRKRFTRVEMARVLMERNQYKERFMELQDAVRWTEMLRAAKQDPSMEKRNNRGILNFFSNLFSKNSAVPIGLTTDRLVSSGGIVPQGSPTKHPGGPVSETSRPNMSTSRPDMSAEKLQLRRLGDPAQRRDAATYKQIKAHVRKDDGRMQAYGWSLPAKSSSGGAASSSGLESPSKGTQGNSHRGKNLPVPVPIYCRPFMEQTPGMKIFCGSGVDVSGGRSKERELSRTYSSPHVWICTATHSASRVAIIDANRPADVLLSFDICASHLLCISSVPGAKEDDLGREEGLEEFNYEEEEAEGDGFGRLTFIREEKTEASEERPEKDEVTMSSVLPTMWLGAQSGFLYVHSAVAQWEKCLHQVCLPDSVLSIAHLRGRTFVSLANGTIGIFRRGGDGQWDLLNYHILDLGKQPHHSIRCLSVVHESIWCGFRNKIHVLDLNTLSVKTTFEAHPRKESQVRQMAACGHGVWISIRLDSTLRLYHAETYEHLQDVDIEPYVSKMLGTGKLGFSYARITALLVASHRLWIGTGNGVIISVPLSESGLPIGSGSRGPGTIVRVNDEDGKEIPYCSMSQAQLSFHGHRDAVKFFVAVPGGLSHFEMEEEEEKAEDVNNPKSNSMLVISGGEGYVDFRVGDGDEGDLKSAQLLDQTQIIIWDVVAP